MIHETVVSRSTVAVAGFELRPRGLDRALWWPMSEYVAARGKETGWA